MSALKASPILPRGEENGARPKGKISKCLSGKCQESDPPPSPAKSSRSPSASPRRAPSQNPLLGAETSCKKSVRKCWQEEQRNQATCHRYLAPAKRSPRRYVSVLEQDFSQDEMGVLRVSGSNCGSDEAEISFLEFESLYTLEKELMRDVGQVVDDKCAFGGWLGGRRGLYTELPDPLYCQRPLAIAAPSSRIPTEGFSFAPGWSLSVEHFYQWQHRGRTTHQVSMRPSRIECLYRRGHGLRVYIYIYISPRIGNELSTPRNGRRFSVCWRGEKERERETVDAPRAVTN